MRRVSISRPRGGIVGAALAAALLAPTSAEAHIIGTRFGDFYAGALHPLTDLADVSTWCAVALLAALCGPQRARWIVAVFPIGLLLGFALGLSTRTAPVVAGLAGQAATAAILVLLGLLLALGRRLPTAALCGVSLITAVARGVANTSGAGVETNVLLFAGGAAAAAYVCVTMVMALVTIFRRCEDQPRNAWRDISLRAVGGWIGAVGIMMLSFALAHAG